MWVSKFACLSFFSFLEAYRLISGHWDVPKCITVYPQAPQLQVLDCVDGDSRQDFICPSYDGYKIKWDSLVFDAEYNGVRMIKNNSAIVLGAETCGLTHKFAHKPNHLFEIGDSGFFLDLDMKSMKTVATDTIGRTTTLWYRDPFNVLTGNDVTGCSTRTYYIAALQNVFKATSEMYKIFFHNVLGVLMNFRTRNGGGNNDCGLAMVINGKDYSNYSSLAIALDLKEYTFFEKLLRYADDQIVAEETGLKFKIRALHIAVAENNYSAIRRLWARFVNEEEKIQIFKDSVVLEKEDIKKLVWDETTDENQRRQYIHGLFQENKEGIAVVSPERNIRLINSIKDIMLSPFSNSSDTFYCWCVENGFGDIVIDIPSFRLVNIMCRDNVTILKLAYSKEKLNLMKFIQKNYVPVVDVFRYLDDTLFIKILISNDNSLANIRSPDDNRPLISISLEKNEQVALFLLERNLVDISMKFICEDVDGKTAGDIAIKRRYRNITRYFLKPSISRWYTEEQGYLIDTQDEDLTDGLTEAVFKLGDANNTCSESEFEKLVHTAGFKINPIATDLKTDRIVATIGDNLNLQWNTTIKTPRQVDLFLNHGKTEIFLSKVELQNNSCIVEIAKIYSKLVEMSNVEKEFYSQSSFEFSLRMSSRDDSLVIVSGSVEIKLPRIELTDIDMAVSKKAFNLKWKWDGMDGNPINVAGLVVVLHENPANIDIDSSKALLIKKIQFENFNASVDFSDKMMTSKGPFYVYLATHTGNRKLRLMEKFMTINGHHHHVLSTGMLCVAIAVPTVFVIGFVGTMVYLRNKRRASKSSNFINFLNQQIHQNVFN